MWLNRRRVNQCRLNERTPNDRTPNRYLVVELSILDLSPPVLLPPDLPTCMWAHTDLAKKPDVLLPDSGLLQICNFGPFALRVFLAIKKYEEWKFGRRLS